MFRAARALIFFILFSNVSFAASVATYVKACEELLTYYGDLYDVKAELFDFWNIHPRFGIIRQDDRFVLITKDEAFNQQLQTELRAWTKSLNEQEGAVSRLETSPVADGIAYDVTAVLPTIAKIYHGRTSRKANCWSFACFNARLSDAITHMHEGEFHFWLSSPLVTKLKPLEELQPGDVIAYRASSGAEIHGATYVSENLTFSKNGARQGIFRLQDSQEVMFIYKMKMQRERRLYIGVELFRVVKTWEQFLIENQALLTPELSSAIETLKRAEELAAQINVFPKEASEDFQVRWQQGTAELERAKRAIDVATNAAFEEQNQSTARDETAAMERMKIWRAVWIRSNSL